MESVYIGGKGRGKEGVRERGGKEGVREKGEGRWKQVRKECKCRKGWREEERGR